MNAGFFCRENARENPKRKLKNVETGLFVIDLYPS